MNKPIHIPILRLGERYDSLDRKPVRTLGSGETLAEISIANPGIIRRDAHRFPAARAALRQFTTRQLLDIAANAGDRFINATLPLGDDQQSPDDYIDQLSRTSGLTHNLVRANMAKIHEVFTQMHTILDGLTRSLELEILDAGTGNSRGISVSYFPTTDALGVVLPSNSPGVNSLWMPAFALKIPVILKPGSEEPFTPWRIVQAFIAAGAPREAFGFYPAEHDGGATVMDVCNRAMIFGGQDTVDRYAGNSHVEVHGPGWSKVILGSDRADSWSDYMEVFARSVAANSGRSCINASTILTPRHAPDIAAALAQRLAALKPLPRDHKDANLSAIANPAMAQWMDQQITEGLQTPGAIDLSQKIRGDTPRLVTLDSVTYLQPTIILCDSFDHPLANREFMFPFCSVVNVPQNEMLDRIGSSLVVSAITDDPKFIDAMLDCPHIQRLNIGPMPTSVARWDQPHEGNLFELLYHRRAIQRAEPSLA